VPIDGSVAHQLGEFFEEMHVDFQEELRSMKEAITYALSPETVREHVANMKQDMRDTVNVLMEDASESYPELKSKIDEKVSDMKQAMTTRVDSMREDIADRLSPSKNMERMKDSFFPSSDSEGESGIYGSGEAAGGASTMQCIGLMAMMALINPLTAVLNPGTSMSCAMEAMTFLLDMVRCVFTE